jgi:hypothetical protein
MALFTIYEKAGVNILGVTFGSQGVVASKTSRAKRVLT